MCLMNAKIFKQITQDELLSLAWNKPNKKIKAPNIVLMTEQFNKVLKKLKFFINKKKKKSYL